MPPTRIAAAENPKEKLERLARAALASNATYLALANPTNAQNAAQLKAVTRQMNNVIRLTARVLDGSAD